MNILEILKNKPLGTKLYTPLVGEVSLTNVTDTYIEVGFNENVIQFDSKGKFNGRGECLLFPSSRMKDWSAFAWNPGDLLTNPVEDNDFVRFCDWNDDYYDTIRIMNVERRFCKNIVCKTSDYVKASEEEVKEIESKYLRPGQRVIVKHFKKDEWALSFFSHYDCLSRPICIGGIVYEYLLPYKGNEKLLGTCDNK